MDLKFDGKYEDFDDILAEMEKENSIADIVKEIGYGCTINELQCKEILSKFSPLNEVTIARLLGMVAHTLVGLQENQNTASTFCVALGGCAWPEFPSPSYWNSQVLVDSIMQLVSFCFYCQL